MCTVVGENAADAVETYLAKKPADLKLKKNLQPLVAIHEKITKIVSPVIESEKSNGDVASSSPHQHESGPVNGAANADVAMEDADGLQDKSNDEPGVIVLE
ncbi:hypothetical protein Hanom_Chr11g01063241 [Helianthus anomalus]